jgi:hypothetical protein
MRKITFEYLKNNEVKITDSKLSDPFVVPIDSPVLKELGKVIKEDFEAFGELSQFIVESKTMFTHILVVG